MKKYLGILVILLVVFNLCGKDGTGFSVEENLILDDLISQSIDKLYNSFQEVPANKFTGANDRTIEGFAMFFENDLEDKVFAEMTRVFTKTRFRMYEKEGVKKILSEQNIQSEDFYSKEGRLKIGNLKQWKGFLFGKVKPAIETNLGKKKIYLEISCNFLNLETGEIVWSDIVKSHKKIFFPLKYFLIGLVLIFLGIIGFNFITRGKKTSMILGLGILILSLYTIWFFII